MILFTLLSSLILIFLFGTNLSILVEAYSHGCNVRWYEWLITGCGFSLGWYLQGVTIYMVNG